MRRAAATAGEAWAGLRAWADGTVAELGAHPARLVWTLLISLAYLAAARPLWNDGHALWAHFQSFFLVNQQVDYGEGPLFNQEVLLLHGQDIYHLVNTPPFAFGNYPPVFPLVAALLMRLHGIGQTFLAGRLTSSLAIMGSGIVAGLIVLQATRQLLAAFIGGAMVYTFSAIYGWGPYNRVDSLALFWSLCTVLLALRYAGTRRAWWVLPFAVLTVYTRQSEVDGIIAAFVYMFWRDWRQCLVIGLAALAAVLAVFAGLQLWSHGAFYLDTVVFNENAWSWSGALGSWTSWARSEGHLPFRLALAGAAAGLATRGRLLWPVWLAGAAVVFATIGKTGSSINYYFPLDAATAVCAGVFIGQFRTYFRRAPFPLWPAELVLPALLFVFIHGSAPAWAARVPLLPRLEAAAGRFTLESSQVARDARSELPRWQRAAKLRAQGHPPARPRLVTPGSVTLLARFYASIPGPVLALDFPHAEVVQGGHQLQWQPFEFGVAYADGHWEPQALLGAIADRYYSAIVLTSFSQFEGYDGDFGTPVVAAVQQNYQDRQSIQGLEVWRPDSAPLAAAPPVVAIDVPQPLSQLAAGLWKALRALPAGLRHGSAGGAPRGVGAFHELDLRQLADVPVATSPGAPAGLGFDGIGDTLPASAFPGAGTLTVRAAGSSVPFYIPPVAGEQPAAVYLGLQVQLPVQAGRYRALWLLEAGVNGAQTVPLTLRYGSGPAQELTLTFSDWCTRGGPPQYPAVSAAFRLDFSGAAVAATCGLYALRVPAAAARTLRAATLGPQPNARILAATVQGA